MRRRWLFGDQLGPHFLDAPDQPVLLVESRAVFRRRRFHRAKAHLILSAIRHWAAELGEQCRFVQTEGYDGALRALRAERVDVCQPTSYAALDFVRSRAEVAEILPARGFATSRDDFEKWAANQRSLLMESFYRDARRRLDVLMDGGEPVSGQWNLDHDNREPPPKRAGRLAVPPPWRPVEDQIDAEVRADLDRWERSGDIQFAGRDGLRQFPVTRAEAAQALTHFIAHRLPEFGRYEDAMLAGDPTMSHSRLSAAMNLGLLHPMEAVRAAEQALADGTAPLNSVEGYVRQLIGWRDYMWHVYWHFGRDYRARNALDARQDIPDWLWDLDPTDVTAQCLHTVLTQVRDTGWVHHIPRLMVLGNWALQRGVRPDELTAWFHTTFVDGYDWVMVANVVGMSQHADGGLMATKPYAAGGAYIDRMSDFCADCAYDPRVRVGPKACPYTAGYWAFLDRNRTRLAPNARMRRPLQNLARLADLGAVRRQERARGTAPP